MIHSSQLTGTSLPGPPFFVDDRNVDTSDFELRGRHWSWLQRRIVRHYVSVSIFVLGSRHFDEGVAFGGQGLRGNSVDQRCVQSELFHGSNMFGTFGLCSGVAENACTWVGYVAESLDHGWSQSSGSGNRGPGRGFRSVTCLPYCRAPDLPQVSLYKGKGLLGELGSSSGGQPPCRFFLHMTCRGTPKPRIFYGVWCNCDGSQYVRMLVDRTQLMRHRFGDLWIAVVMVVGRTPTAMTPGRRNKT